MDFLRSPKSNPPILDFLWKTHSRIPPLNFVVSTHGGQIAGRHGAVAASRCRNPTACSRYPAIRGCSTRSTRSCGSSRTASRAVCRRLRAARERGTAFLNQFTQTCNSKLILAIRQLLGALQVCAAPLPTPPRYLLISPPVARRWLLRMVRWSRTSYPPPRRPATLETFEIRRNWNT